MTGINASQLILQLPGLTTGTTFFCHHPGPVLCKIIRAGLNSPYDHSATYVFKDGKHYIVEAKGGEEIHLKPFYGWLADRLDNTFYVSPAVVDYDRIASQFGKKYDYKSALLYMPLYQLTGEWFGPVRDEASEEFFCFELSAWYREIPEWWRCVPKNFPETILETQTNK